MEETKIKEIKNVPYCPHFNGIELVWGVLKHRFRKALIEKKIKVERIDLKPVIKELIDELPNELIYRCGWNGFN